MTNVFVYGTLMKGLRFHKPLENSKFLGYGVVSGELFRIKDIQGLVPGVQIIYKTGEKCSNIIRGEIYEVNDLTLRELDKIEGHPHLYRRGSVKAFLLGTWPGEDPLLDVQIYTFPHSGYRGPTIESGSWRKYLETL